MDNLTKSASKLVLLYLTIILGILALAAGIIGLIKGTLDPKELITIFAMNIALVLGYYFNSKGDPSQPYGGK